MNDTTEVFSTFHNQNVTILSSYPNSGETIHSVRLANGKIALISDSNLIAL